MMQEKRGGSGRGRARAAGGNAGAGRETRRRAVPSRGDMVISGGASYERSMVGDRLEASSTSLPKPPSVNTRDYDNYLSSFGGVSDRAVRKPGTPQTAADRRKAKKARRSRRKIGEFDPDVQGSTIREAAARFLPKMSVRLVASAIAAIITGLLIYYVYMGIYVTYRTEKVTLSPYLETIDVEGIAIRDEILLDGKMSKSSVKAVQNGEKVSKGQTIVNVYSSSQEAAAFERIVAIDREIEILRSMETASEDSANTVDSINRQLDSRMADLNMYGQQRRIPEISALRSEISYLLSKRMVAMRQGNETDERIAALTAEKDELQKKYSKKPKTVAAPDAGYFVDKCDGYETLLTTSDVAGLTVDRLDEIMNSKSGETGKHIGKLVGSFSWYLACPVSAIDADFLTEKLIYTLYLPYSETESIEAELAYLNKEEGEDRFLAIFRCSSLASELCTVRRQPVRIQKCKYEGFMIKKSALHAGLKDFTYKNPHPEEDFPRAHLVFVIPTTYPSVYTIVAGQVKEKEVSIVYGTDKMVICSPKHGNGDYLSLDDTVVIEERGLYNGKIVG